MSGPARSCGRRAWCALVKFLRQPVVIFFLVTWPRRGRGSGLRSGRRLARYRQRGHGVCDRPYRTSTYSVAAVRTCNRVGQEGWLNVSVFMCEMKDSATALIPAHPERTHRLGDPVVGEPVLELSRGVSGEVNPLLRHRVVGATVTARGIPRPRSSSRPIFGAVWSGQVRRLGGRPCSAGRGRFLLGSIAEWPADVLVRRSLSQLQGMVTASSYAASAAVVFMTASNSIGVNLPSRA